jgi:hypothetical protein
MTHGTDNRSGFETSLQRSGDGCGTVGDGNDTI